MPATQSLQWLDITDMSPGLWEETAAYNKLAAPPNAFRQLTDYQPTKGGGLRPWYKATAMSTAGTYPGANERCMGIFVRSGVIRTGAGGTGNKSTDILMVTMNGSDKKMRIYRLDGTVASPAWTLNFTSAANNDDYHEPVDFALFTDKNSVDWAIMAIQCNGTPSGLYKMQYDYTVASGAGSDGTVTKINAFAGPMLISQARIIASSGNTLQFSDVGLTTFSGAPTSGSLAVAPNRGSSNIKSISGIEPSDLLVGKEGAPWVQISGDVSSTSTPVREMSDAHHTLSAKQQTPHTPSGIAFIEMGGRVFETDGRNFKALSNQLSTRTRSWSGNMVTGGQLAYGDGYLPIPGHNSDTSGVVYDYESDAWFVMSAINPVFSWYDAQDGVFYHADNSLIPNFVQVPVLAAAGASRVSTGIIRTVPYADKNGRNIDIREVQMFAITTAATEFKVEILDENDVVQATRYAAESTARKGMWKVQFPATKSEYLSVRITPRTYDGTSEAPTFEHIRVGFGINNLIR